MSAVYLLWILITSPDDSSCDIFCLSPHRGEMQDIALITGALLAGTSAPLWVWLAIGEMVRSSRRSIGRDAAWLACHGDDARPGDFGVGSIRQHDVTDEVAR